MQKLGLVFFSMIFWGACSSTQRSPNSQTPCPISLFFPSSSTPESTAWEIVESQLPKLDPEDERALTLFAFEKSDRRSKNTAAHMAFYGYKNVPTGPKVLVDFSKQDPTRVSLELQRIPELQKAYPRFPPTTHEYRMLRLKRGDRIQFEDRQFRLGSFLGAGNTTHIWEIQDDPTKALRLPFLAAGLVKKAQVESKLHQIDAGRLWAFHYVHGIKKLKTRFESWKLIPSIAGFWSRESSRKQNGGPQVLMWQPSSSRPTWTFRFPKPGWTKRKSQRIMGNPGIQKSGNFSCSLEKTATFPHSPKPYPWCQKRSKWPGVRLTQGPSSPLKTSDSFASMF